MTFAVVCPEEYLDERPEEDGEDLLLQFDDLDDQPEEDGEDLLSRFDDFDEDEPPIIS